MAISFTCDHCGKSFEVPDYLGNRTFKCYQCRGVITVPVTPNLNRTILDAYKNPPPIAQPPPADAPPMAPEMEPVFGEGPADSYDHAPVGFSQLGALPGPDTGIGSDMGSGSEIGSGSEMGSVAGEALELESGPPAEEPPPSTASADELALEAVAPSELDAMSGSMDISGSGASGSMEITDDSILDAPDFADPSASAGSTGGSFEEEPLELSEDIVWEEENQPPPASSVDDQLLDEIIFEEDNPQ